MNAFKLNGLDHIALRVSNLELSSRWYQETLGLKEYRLEKWGPFPLFLLAGRTGLALFPKAEGDNRAPDHFAFKLDYAEFEKAQQHLQNLDINFVFQDHHYFHSIYFTDPDQHTVELTCIVVNPNTFYKEE